MPWMLMQQKRAEGPLKYLADIFHIFVGLHIILIKTKKSLHFDEFESVIIHIQVSPYSDYSVTDWLIEKTRLKSRSVYTDCTAIRDMSSAPGFMKILTTEWNSHSETSQRPSHSWCTTQTVSHPSSNVTHCCLISVVRHTPIALPHSSWSLVTKNTHEKRDL